MICYKDVDDEFISQISGHQDVLEDLFTKPSINLEPNFDDDHIPTEDINYQKIFYQIDSTWLYNPNRDILLSALESFDQFCDSQFQISIYPISIYQQIIKIGIEKIQDFQIISKVLSISLYVCSSRGKEFIKSIGIFPFLYQICNFFNDIQVEKQNHLEQMDYDTNYDEVIFNYIDIFNQTVFFLSCLEPFYEKNDEELKKIIPLFLNIILTNISNNQNTNENDQITNNHNIDFSRVFDYLYLLIPLFRFSEDEMIQINHFFIEFLDKTNLIYFNSSFLKAVYRTKSWQYNIFKIFNEIFINYMKNCFLFISQSLNDENIIQDETKCQDLVNLMKYSFKIFLKIDSNFSEIYDINFEALNGLPNNFFINSFIKCVEKNLKKDILPNDVLALFNFAFDCFLNCEFKTQKSSIGLISQLSEICIDNIYKNIVECLGQLYSFIETGNIEITKNILIILHNVINFCAINDQDSFNIILDDIIGQNILLITYDSLNEIDQDNIEITDLIRCIDEHIKRYQSKIYE